jgi:hypothetical protein
MGKYFLVVTAYVKKNLLENKDFFPFLFIQFFCTLIRNSSECLSCRKIYHITVAGPEDKARIVNLSTSTSVDAYDILT